MPVLTASLRKLRDQINAAFPNRDKTSDGWIGDARHAARKSDHNPTASGVVHAIDVDEDRIPAARIVDELVASRDSRLKYVIYEGRIWYPSSGWRRYTGTNPHDKHFHVSAYAGTDASTWRVPALGGQSPVLEEVWNSGLSLEQKRTLQRVLNSWYPDAINLKLDGIYGPATFSAVRYTQSRLKLLVDGKAGPVTRKALNIPW